MSIPSRIPKSALEHHIAFVGKTGSAKTGSVKSSIVEPGLANEERTCVIDPTGAWWGLRLAADGKSKGLPIYVFGGDHGDYPLLGTQGEMMAEAIGGSNTPAILDTTKMKTGERMRFFTDFADTILRTNQGPLRLVTDECHLFAPQAGTRGSGLMPDMLHAANNLISLGRSRGLRIVLISQRPAKVHKDSLTQVETLVAMRLIAPQDRKAVEEWIADQADKETGKEIIASLPSLKNGEGWVWSPEANFLKRVVFPMPKTYDSSKVQGTGNAKKRLSPIDLEKLQVKFAKVKAEGEAKDPKILQRRVTELEAENRKLKATPAAAAPVDKTAEKQTVADRTQKAATRGKIDGYGEAMKDIAAIFRDLAPTMAKLLPLAASIEENGKRIEGWAARTKEKQSELAKLAPEELPALRSLPPDPTRDERMQRHRERLRERAKPAAASNGDGTNTLSNSERKIIDAIRWWNVLGVPVPSHAQTAFVAGYSHKSGTWATYLSRLRSAGMIEGRGFLALTEEGHNNALEPDAPPTREALWSAVLGKIDAPLQKILKPIIAAYPDGLSHAAAGEAAGYSPSSGTWATYLSRLRTLDLIDGRGELKAQGWLFP